LNGDNTSDGGFLRAFLHSLGRVQTANTEDILPNRKTKGGENGVDSNSHITGFSLAILKK
jgi:hypothetical protein